jgi:lytic murein transglycosylase
VHNFFALYPSGGPGATPAEMLTTGLSAGRPIVADLMLQLQSSLAIMTPEVPVTRINSPIAIALIWAISLVFCAGPAVAADCQQQDTFGPWFQAFKQDAAKQGISPKTISAALDGVTLDPSVITRDHAQSVFKQSFEQFSGRMVSTDRLRKGSDMLKRYGSILSRIEDRYGVQGTILVAIWGLETDYGVNQGKFSTLRSLSTLAFDCRRADKFRGELLDALRIVDRGDLAPREMIGAWAGELGQTQLLPSSYYKFAVDFDGYGRRDLIHSPLNALASTANYLKSYGWATSQPWTEGSPNFDVLHKWNESDVYTKTVAYFATRLDKEP